MDAKFINFVATTKNGYVTFGTGGQKMAKKWIKGILIAFYELGAISSIYFVVKYFEEIVG